jgi:hypothetical protein
MAQPVVFFNIFRFRLSRVQEGRGKRIFVLPSGPDSPNIAEN